METKAIIRPRYSPKEDAIIIDEYNRHSGDGYKEAAAKRIKAEAGIIRTPCGVAMRVYTLLYPMCLVPPRQRYLRFTDAEDDIIISEARKGGRWAEEARRRIMRETGTVRTERQISTRKHYLREAYRLPLRKATSSSATRYTSQEDAIIASEYAKGTHYADTAAQRIADETGIIRTPTAIATHVQRMLKLGLLEKRQDERKKWKRSCHSSKS